MQKPCIRKPLCVSKCKGGEVIIVLAHEFELFFNTPSYPLCGDVIYGKPLTYRNEREGHRRLFVSDVLNVAEFYVSPHSQMTMSYFLVPRQRELRRRLVLRRHHPIQRKSTISLSAPGRPFGITLRNCPRSQSLLSASTATRRYVHWFTPIV